MINEKLVRHAETTLRKIVPYKYNVSAEEVEDAYRAVIEAVKQGAQLVWWRKVEDWLPQHGEDVLVTDGKQISTALSINRGDFLCDDVSIDRDDIIAWMPLPEVIRT